jgi:CubicO group peptidase (beta-lactamase class C family)
MEDITIQQLLDHSAGFDPSDPKGPEDVSYHMRDVSQRLGFDRAPNISE